jgi:CRP-like cAMP-binding protein
VQSDTGERGEPTSPAVHRLAARAWPAKSFLGLLTVEERCALLSLGRLRRIAVRHQLLSQGDDSQHVLVILQGVARISAATTNGHSAVLGFRSAGDLIGEMAYFTGAERSASVTALTEVPMASVPGVRFAEFLEAHHHATHLAAGIVSNRLRAANERRKEYNAFDAPARVAHVIADVATQHALEAEEGLVLGASYTQADLASLASVSPRTIEKLLKLFEESGLVVRRGRELIIRDPKALREFENSKEYPA